MGTSLPAKVVPRQFSTFDKVVHFSIYAVLGYLLTRSALRGRSLLAVLGAVVVGVAGFGAIDEWHQQFIPGRYTEVLDWVADVAGGAAGSLAAVLINQFRIKHKQA